MEYWSGTQNGVVEAWSDGLATDGTPIKHGYDRAGQMVGKWTGFAHLTPGSGRLGPDDSTQVVDFPHPGRVRVFWDAVKSENGRVATGGIWSYTDSRKPLNRKERRKQRVEGWKSVKYFVLFHAFSRFITEIRPVITRFSRFLG